MKKSKIQKSLLELFSDESCDQLTGGIILIEKTSVILGKGYTNNCIDCNPHDRHPGGTNNCAAMNCATGCGIQ